MTKYPHIKVNLIGNDSNVFFIIGRVVRCLRENGVSPEEIAEFEKQVTSGDYSNALSTVQEWVTVT